MTDRFEEIQKRYREREFEGGYETFIENVSEDVGWLLNQVWILRSDIRALCQDRRNSK